MLDLIDVSIVSFVTSLIGCAFWNLCESIYDKLKFNRQKKKYPQ